MSDITAAIDLRQWTFSKKRWRSLAQQATEKRGKYSKEIFAGSATILLTLFASDTVVLGAVCNLSPPPPRSRGGGVKNRVATALFKTR